MEKLLRWLFCAARPLLLPSDPSLAACDRWLCPIGLLPIFGQRLQLRLGLGLAFRRAAARHTSFVNCFSFFFLNVFSVNFTTFFLPKKIAYTPSVLNKRLFDP